MLATEESVCVWQALVMFTQRIHASCMYSVYRLYIVLKCTGFSCSSHRVRLYTITIYCTVLAYFGKLEQVWKEGGFFFQKRL